MGVELYRQVRALGRQRREHLADAREFLGLSAEGHADRFALSLAACGVGHRLMERRLLPLAECLLLAQLFGRGARLGDEPRVVLVQLRDLVLLHNRRLVGLAQFRLQLLDLLLVPARLLLALLAGGRAEMRRVGRSSGWSRGLARASHGRGRWGDHARPGGCQRTAEVSIADALIA